MVDCLFVYGTLLRAVGHGMHAFLSRNAEFAGEAVFNGRLYLVAHYPGAVPSVDPNEKVFGELYRLRRAADFLPALDDYEGCGPKAPQPAEYIRETRPVNLAGGNRVHAWIYIYKRPVDDLPRIVSGRFLEHMDRAAFFG